MFNKLCVETSKMDGFQSDIQTIKGYLCDIGNTFLLVAFRIYEMNRNGSYKKYYKNIVEACEVELGFKKSTTYNMLNIVKRFGVPDEHGQITYNSFVQSEYNYSQLCEMLSLSDKQLEKVTPQMTVKEIRDIKKVQTSGKKDDIIDVPADEVLELSEPSEQVPIFQTSGKVDYYDYYIKLKEENQQLRFDRVNAMNRAENAERELAKVKAELEELAVETDLKCACTCLICCFSSFLSDGKLYCSKLNDCCVEYDFYCAFAE